MKALASYLVPSTHTLSCLLFSYQARVSCSQVAVKSSFIKLGVLCGLRLAPNWPGLRVKECGDL